MNIMNSVLTDFPETRESLLHAQPCAEGHKHSVIKISNIFEKISQKDIKSNFDQSRAHLKLQIATADAKSPGKAGI